MMVGSFIKIPIIIIIENVMKMLLFEKLKYRKEAEKFNQNCGKKF